MNTAIEEMIASLDTLLEGKEIIRQFLEKCKVKLARERFNQGLQDLHAPDANPHYSIKYAEEAIRYKPDLYTLYIMRAVYHIRIGMLAAAKTDLQLVLEKGDQEEREEAAKILRLHVYPDED